MEVEVEKLSKEELEALIEEFEQKVFLNHGYSGSVKVLANGGYGALSNLFNRWYSDEIAESITLSGQLAEKWVERALNRWANRRLRTEEVDYIVAADTDSVYFVADMFVERAFKDQNPTDKEKLIFLENLATELEKVINEALDELYAVTNAYEKKLFMKLEAIGSAIWIAKKRYAMLLSSFKRVHYDPPKVKMQGIEAVRSSTPQICREWIKESIPKIISGDTQWLKKFVEDAREEFYSLPFDRVASPRSVSDIDKYYDKNTIYTKGCPIAVRGALLYNNMVKVRKLDNELPLLSNGDRVRFCYMKIPNPVMENVFACPDELPEELQLDEYIDYPKQFAKVFFEPINNIVKAAGLDISDKIDISQFFSIAIIPTEELEPDNGVEDFDTYEEDDDYASIE